MPSFGRFRTQRSVQWTLRLAQDLTEPKLGMPTASLAVRSPHVRNPANTCHNLSI